VQRSNIRLPSLGIALAILAACRRDDPPAPVVTLIAQPAAPAAAPAAPPAQRQPAFSTQPDPVRADFIRAHYAKYEYRIPMRDGVRLFTAVYVPNDAGAERRYPFLLFRTPYSVAPYGIDRYAPRLGQTDAYERDGFIFVAQDVRGAHMSEGEFVNVRPHIAKKRGSTDVDESTDTHDTISWLLRNVPHNNGKVGQWGISYPGFYAAAGAIDSHPALVAVSPQAPIADWFRGDDMHRHGAFNLHLAFSFFSVFGRARPSPTSDEERKSFDFGTPDVYQFFLDAGPLADLEKKHLKGEIAFWNDITAHPDYDEFWQARNLLPHLRNIKAATLVVGGWYDTEDLYGPLSTYRAIEEQNPRASNRLVMGPWSHGGWLRTFGSELGDTSFGFPTSDTYQPLELAFFRHHLKGAPDPHLPEALVFETGANRWRSLDAWPPRAARQARLYFGAGGVLSFDPPAPSSPAGFDEYVSDPARPVPYTQEMTPRWSKGYMTEDQRFAARRPDVLVYATPPLERDVTLAGPLEAELYVSTTGTDADFVVKLIDVQPGKLPGWSKADEDADKRDRGGQQILVRGEPFRARYRDSYTTPAPLVPGQVTRIAFAINDVFHTFQRGHRIMVQVQSSWFPFIDRNPQKFVPSIYRASAADFVTATHRVHRGPAAPSALRVGILPSPDE
jgi:putative CocE/NonD family hydrolase